MIISEKEYKASGLSPLSYINLKALYEKEDWLVNDEIVERMLVSQGYVRRVSDKYVPTVKADHLFLHSAKVTEVLEHFKAVTGKRINTDSKPNREFVSGRLKDGYTVEELKQVIEYQNYLCKQGRFDKTYLRIETLFSPTKFESYVGNALLWNKEEITSNIRMV